MLDKKWQVGKFVKVVNNSPIIQNGRIGKIGYLSPLMNWVHVYFSENETAIFSDIQLEIIGDIPSEIDDIEYFRKSLFRPLVVPLKINVEVIENENE